MNITRNRSAKRFLIFSLISILSSLVFATTSLAWNSSFSHGWTFTPDIENLSAGAGSDYTDTIQSPLYCDALTIEADGPWSLFIEGDPVQWNSEILLFFRAMSPFSDALHDIQDSFLQITTDQVKVASGEGSVELVGIQYQLKGLSVEQFKPSSWNTDITFTIIEE